MRPNELRRQQMDVELESKMRGDMCTIIILPSWNLPTIFWIFLEQQKKKNPTVEWASIGKQVSFILLLLEELV